MQISVVIPASRQADKIDRVLQGLGAQSLQQFEVVVVDNGLTEPAAQIVLDHTRRFPSWRMVREPKLGAAAARNSGVRVSGGEVIVFVDDDVVPDPNLVEEHLRIHRQEPDVIVLGSVRFPWTGKETSLHWLLARRPGLLQSFAFPNPQDVPFLHFYTCNLSLRRSIFVAEGGFDESFSGYGFEDTELGYRLKRSGHRIVFNPRASALHEVRVEFSWISQKRYQAGRSLHHLTQKHPELADLLLAPSTTWRRKISSMVGLYSRPLASWFDARNPWLASLTLPFFGRLCQCALEYQFLKGLKQARREARRASSGRTS